MKNNIKKAPVKFWEDLFFCQHFMQIFVFCSKSVIISNLTGGKFGFQVVNLLLAAVYFEP